MTFIERWKSAWKFISVQCFGMIGAIHGAIGLCAMFGIDAGKIYAAHPTIIGGGTVVLAVLGIFGVLIQQDSLPDWVPWKLNHSATSVASDQEKKP